MKQKTTIFLFLILTMAGLTILSSCHLVQNTIPSVLIIAVDNLGVNELNCSPDSQSQTRSGISVLCQESIRFTHAYTTSPLSGPALTSILMGQYPLQHGLRNNEKSFLPGRVTTLAEMAQKNGMSTAFFSGGAPVLRKLNLQQGFETFDDVWTPTTKLLFRPFLKTQSSFDSWIQDIGKQNFFSVFYVPDLAHTFTPTQTDLGETRNLSFESQLEEFDESLLTLIQHLKSRNKWNSTLVVLVGLNGPATQHHTDELLHTNLFSERTQVGLLLKPPQKPRDQGINWSFDENVTIADIGTTLIDIFSGQAPQKTGFPLHSLRAVFKSPAAEIKERPLLIESSWNEAGPTRYAIRWNQHLFLLDEDPQAFNSFIDKLESTPIKVSDPSVRPIWEKIQRLADLHSLSPWPQIQRRQFLKWQGLVEIWSTSPDGKPHSSFFERLAHRLKQDPEVVETYNRELLKQQNWPELKKWSTGMGFKDLEKIALKNLKQEVKGGFQDPCLKALEMTNPKTKDLKQCLNPTASSLIEWVLAEKKELNETHRENARKKFLRQYLLYDLDQRIVEMNWALEGPWDISMALRIRKPLVEMMLALPEMQKYRQAAQKAVQQSKPDEVVE